MSDTTPKPRSPANHVFVDFENVHDIPLTAIGGKAVSFTLLMGARQTKLDADLVEKLLEHAASVQLVRLTSSGKNALDFTLAYYLGRAVAADPAGHFHIVSRDAGFDPLVEHLRTRHTHVERHNNFADLDCPAHAESSAAVPAELLARVLDHLRKHPANRPKRETTLTRHLKTHLGAKETGADIPGIVVALRQKGHVAIDAKGAVTYHL